MHCNKPDCQKLLQTFCVVYSEVTTSQRVKERTVFQRYLYYQLWFPSAVTTLIRKIKRHMQIWHALLSGSHPLTI